MNYEPYIDKLMQHYTAEPYEQEVVQAKQEFSRLVGAFDEEAPDFEMKMYQFVDWYLFSRRLNSSGEIPAHKCFSDPEFAMSDDEQVYFTNLKSSRHSLFEFLKLKGDDVYIRDLFSGYKLVIKKSAITIGFNREEYFEARLIPHEDSFVFSGAFCFHPPQASKFLLKEVKKVKKTAEDQRDEARESLILRLFKMRYKHEQYKHVDVKEIYSNDPKLRI